MNSTIKDIDAQIAELQAAKLELVKAKQEAIVEASKAFMWEYDWQVTFPHPAKIRIERKLTDDCLARLAAFEAEHETAFKPFVGDMTYSILIGDNGNLYAERGGGCIIVKFDPQHNGFGPELLSRPIYDELRKGHVPVHIRRP